MWHQGHIFVSILLLPNTILAQVGLCMKVTHHVQLFVTPWTVAHQATPFMGFSRQEYWSGLPFQFAGDLPNPGIKLRSPPLQADSLPSEPPKKPGWIICI